MKITQFQTPGLGGFYALEFSTLAKELEHVLVPENNMEVIDIESVAFARNHLSCNEVLLNSGFPIKEGIIYLPKDIAGTRKIILARDSPIFNDLGNAAKLHETRQDLETTLDYALHAFKETRENSPNYLLLENQLTQDPAQNFGLGTITPVVQYLSMKSCQLPEYNVARWLFGKNTVKYAANLLARNIGEIRIYVDSDRQINSHQNPYCNLLFAGDLSSPNINGASWLTCHKGLTIAVSKKI